MAHGVRDKAWQNETAALGLYARPSAGPPGGWEGCAIGPPPFWRLWSNGGDFVPGSHLMAHRTHAPRRPTKRFKETALACFNSLGAAALSPSKAHEGKIQVVHPVAPPLRLDENVAALQHDHTHGLRALSKHRVATSQCSGLRFGFLDQLWRRQVGFGDGSEDGLVEGHIPSLKIEMRLCRGRQQHKELAPEDGGNQVVL
eukprot:CAMPEP_0204085086 /NCGR_PEP_ID=MMETSP0360-20130528/181007_1 /ASSEMBLY_ACC=CAM_ASM_000342 /TAXON_ID=268821 /ORGANISM="Scrippsiella Hangoei, Strain SHTV-5" /LENGTH=199 /DNA_ID=CAMNT_0051034121 /DNA_START=125 /DNA_END=726 /DNA_ORIENTATION=-